MSINFEVSAIQKLSELQEFASIYHQDFAYDGEDFRLGAVNYLRGLKLARRRALMEQIDEFLAAELTEAKARSLWKSIGADWLPKKINLLEELAVIRGMLAIE